MTKEVREILEKLEKNGNIFADDIINAVQKHPDIILSAKNMSKEEIEKIIGSEKSGEICEKLINITKSR